jgi:MoaA/NifB/PqqE/SkfB family radical SAM enzyme
MKDLFSEFDIQPQLKIVQIQPTNSCNLNCIFCDHRKPINEISYSIWKKIAKEIRTLEPAKVTITGGGEPMVVGEKTMVIGEEIKRNPNIVGDIVSNGTLFNEKQIKKLIRIQWDNLTFSIHSPIFEVDNFLRGKKGAFEATIKTVKLINDLKKRYKSSLPKLSFIMVITRYNYNHVEKMIKLAAELNLNSVCLRLVNENPSLGIKVFPTEIQMEELRKEIDGAKKTASELHIDLFTEFSEEIFMKKRKRKEREKKESVYCTVPFFEAVIFSDGIVAPCCLFYVREEMKNNFFKENIKEKGFKSIWYGKTFNLFRMKMIKNEPLDLCLHCTPDSRYKHEIWFEYTKKKEVSELKRLL